jgi:hypothetical protein
VVYVIDASAFIQMQEICEAKGHDFGDALARLTTLREADQVIFPPLVVRDCREFGDTDYVTSWVRTASAALQGNSPGYDKVGEVLSQCPLAVDVDDDRESAELEVLALALSRHQDGASVTVVTGQWIDSPTRQAVGNASVTLGLLGLDTGAFVEILMS